MKLELNLVSVSNVYSPVYELLKRKRINYEGGVSGSIALNAIKEFLIENLDSIEPVVLDKNAVNLISSGAINNLSDLLSLKWSLAMSGIDVTYHLIAPEEVNEVEIPNDKLEYTLIDQNWVEENFLRVANKINIDSITGSIASVHRQAAEIYQFFSSDKFSDNQLMEMIKTEESIEKTTGQIPPAISQNVNAMFSYLGKTFEVYVPQS